MLLRIIIAAMWIIIALGYPDDGHGAEVYDPQTTLERGGVGTHSPKLKEPVKPAAPAPAPRVTIICREDPAWKLGKRVICEEKK
jgi:hypothetical protein